MNGLISKLNVMQVILTLEQAGAQRVVCTLVEHLQQRDCSVVVCAFQDGPMRAEIEELGVKVEILSRPRYSVLLLPLFVMEMLRIRRQLVHLVEVYRIDIVQTHILFVLDFLVATLRLNTRPRVILWTMQNVEFLPKKHPNQIQWLRELKVLGYRLLYRVLSKWVDGFIAVSDQVRDSILQLVGPVDDKTFTICNAVDLKPFAQPGDKVLLCSQLGIQGSAHLVATVGRLTEQKGHCYLIDAAAHVVEAFPNTHFLFVGDGELGDALKERAHQAGLLGSIHFLGLRKDVPSLLMAVDLFVQPSLWEGLSVALLEAMAAGKPIVATAVSGTTQALASGKTGIVVPTHDSMALASAITQLLSDPVQAQEMGLAAKQHVKAEFGAQKQADEHLALYYRLLSDHE